VIPWRIGSRRSSEIPGRYLEEEAELDLVIPCCGGYRVVERIEPANQALCHGETRKTIVAKTGILNLN